VFILYVVDSEIIPNTPPFELPQECLAPVLSFGIFKLSTAEYPRCEKTLYRETNMCICLLAYEQSVELVKDREYWYHQYIVTPPILVVHILGKYTSKGE